MRINKSFILFVFNISLFANVEFSLLFKSQIGNTISKTKVRCYLNNQNLRFDFIFPYFKNESDIEQSKKDFVNDNVYWIYNFKNYNFFIVNPKKAAYYEFPDKIIFSLFSENKNIKDIKNIKVVVKRLNDEKIGKFVCYHYYINFTYEILLSLHQIDKKIWIEEKKEIWATNNLIFKDIPLTIKKTFILSGIEQIDSIILKKMDTKELGFVLKLLNCKLTRENNKIKQYTSELKIANVVENPNISSDIFIIPKNYKKINIEFKN